MVLVPRRTPLTAALPLLALPLLALALAAPAARAQTVEGGNLFVTSTGNVVATYRGNSASYSNDLYLFSPTNNLGLIFNNQATPVGTTKDLGTFTAGTELVFELYVNNTQTAYFTGPASRNPDNHAHARVTYDYSPTEVLVEFEDLFNGPFQYNDLSFSFTNLQVTAPPPTPPTTSAVPEPSEYATAGMLGATLLFGMVRARRRKPAAIA